MKTSILLTAAISILFALPLCAQTQQKVKIEQATVFLNGAELISTAKVNLSVGESEVIFTNIAGNVNQQSVSVGADNSNVAVQSATFKNDYLQSEVLSPKAKSIKDSIDVLSDENKVLDNKIFVIDEQLATLKDNHKVGGNNSGLSVAELQKMLDLMSTKMNAFLSDKSLLHKKLDKNNEKIALLNKQLDEERKKDFLPGGQLVVKFYNTQAITSNITITYIVPNAGWTPNYDLRVERLNDPVKLYYKANVYQNSGVKWDNVHLVLSTGNPNEGAQSPVLNPWYLSFNNVFGSANARNIVANYNKATPMADNSLLFNSAQGLASPDEASMNKYVTVDNSGITTTFDIDIPYTIPSDGQQHMVAVKSHELPATYRYYAAPKADKDAFLQAQVTKWEDLNLLPAQTNIFYEGTYVGQGYIDMRNVEDTLNLSLGRDKKIIIHRDRDKDFKSSKVIGTNKRETYVYTISVRNTKKEPIDLTIMDQFPVSNDKDIVIEDKDADGATIDDTSGAVKWIVKIAPNETLKKKLTYTVKYPKDKVIQNLK